jgi:hypothetical protein
MPTVSTCAKCGWSRTLPGRQVAAACPACGSTAIRYKGGTFAGGGPGRGAWLGGRVAWGAEVAGRTVVGVRAVGALPVSPG